MALIQGEKPSGKVYAAFGIIMVVLIGITIASTSGNSNPNTPPAQASTAKLDAGTAKKIADAVKVQSTGYSYNTDKSQITYGFILDNSQEFTGTVSITLKGTNGNLANALEFTENNLAVGAGDVSSVKLSGRYTEYSYKVTVDSQTFSYAGGQIPVNE